jgi:protein-L-isoaspartate(D-aspartate) O-methyltransferase
MVERLSQSGIQDPVVLNAFGEVPRHLFVEEALMEKSYGTHALPIGYRQTISQPEIAARMTEMLQLRPEERVLEVGTGSGYQAAILARLVREVLTVERIPQLAARAKKVLSFLEMSNVSVRVCDGSLGLGRGEIFDAILVTAAAPVVPEPLLAHLGERGRMVIPVGSGRDQHLYRIVRQGEEFLREDRGPCTFVKLVGKSRWANLPETNP